MYAVVRTGGKQYRVAKDDVIVVEKLAGAPGAELELDQVLMLDNGKETQIGAPLVDGARVAATVIDQGRGDKIIVFKKKRRKDYRRTRGHRQSITVLRINEILGKGDKRSAAKAKAPARKEQNEAPEAAEKPAAAKKAEAEKPAAKKPAAKKPAAKKPAAKKAAPRKPAARKAGAKESGSKKPASRGRAKKSEENE